MLRYTGWELLPVPDNGKKRPSPLPKHVTLAPRLECCSLNDQAGICTGKMRSGRKRALRWWDAHCIGTTGTDPGTCDGMEAFVHADLYGREIVTTAAQCEARAGDCRIGCGEEIKNLIGPHRCLGGEVAQFWWDRDGAIGGARGSEEVVCAKPGTGAMSVPFVFEKSRIRVDVLVRGRIDGPRRVRAVLRVCAVLVLRPQTVEYECGVCSTLLGVGVRVAELWRPGQVQQIEIEARCSRSLISACG
jgi:hypothetical protein